MKWKAAELFPGKYITSLLTIYAMHEKNCTLEGASSTMKSY